VQHLTEIEYEGKRYTFSWWSIGLFALFAPIIAILVYELTDIFWLYTHESVVSQTVWVINALKLMDPPIDYYLTQTHYVFAVPHRTNIGFETMCTGIQANAIFAGIILMIPHSKDKEANHLIWIRKFLALAVSWILFYVVNIIRMVIQLTLYENGANWDDIHTSISAASSFIAAIIILIMHRWIPEFIISIVWILGELRSFLEKKRNINVIDEGAHTTQTPTSK